MFVHILSGFSADNYAVANEANLDVGVGDAVRTNVRTSTRALDLDTPGHLFDAKLQILRH